MCGKDPSDVARTYGVAPDHAPYFCLDLSFCHTVLTQGFDLSENTQLSLVKQVRGLNAGVLTAGWQPSSLTQGASTCRACQLSAAACGASAALCVGSSCSCPCAGAGWPTVPAGSLAGEECGPSRRSGIPKRTAHAPPHNTISLLQVKYNGQTIEAAWPLGAALHELSS